MLIRCSTGEQKEVKGHPHRKGKWCLANLFMLTILLFNTIVFSGEYKGWKDLEGVLAEIEKANESLKTLKANVVYTRTITLLEYEEVSDGKLYYKKPKRMYLEFFSPRDEINVLDGKYIWVYHPSENQVEKYELVAGKRASQGASFFEFGYGESVRAVKKNYDIVLLDRRQEGKKRFYILRLLPKDPKARYSEIRLWVEHGFWLPSKIELYESGGEVVNIIEMKNIKLNRLLSDKRFQFNVPGWVEVIEPFK